MQSDAFDLLSFLESRKGSINCGCEGEIRITVTDQFYAAADDVMAVMSLLRRHNPDGKIEVFPYEGSVTVRLLSKEVSE